MIKYVGYFKGARVVLREADYEQTLKRFTYGNAEHKDGMYEIKVMCSLCVKFRDSFYNNCNGCTFNKFGGYAGCMRVLSSILNKKDKGWTVYPPLVVSPNTVYWSGFVDAQAKERLDAIKDVLLDMRRIET